MLRTLLLITAAAVCIGASPVAAQQLKTAASIALPATAPGGAAGSAWYPANCVGIDYCAAVDHVIWMAPSDGRGGQLMVTSLHGTATMQRGFVVQESRDRHMHVCMRFDPFGGLEVTCLLVPAS